MMKQALATLALLWIPACVYAADGQVLISQAVVNAAGGFPYVITQPGSYKLSSNLLVGDKNKTAIRIAADFVTIDLNGFSIIGPNDCSSGTCSASGGGNGIETAVSRVFFNITIRNGTVQGMGFNGIHLVGDAFLVEYMHIRSNDGNGIYLERFAGGSGVPAQLVTVEHCNVELNRSGIVVDGGQVNYNNSSRNRIVGIGILASNGSASVTHNVVVDNLQYGLVSSFSALIYNSNLLRNNSVNVSGGFNTGGNLCGNALCP